MVARYRTFIRGGYMKRWVIGDIHGNYRGLKQCFERCGLNYDEDEVRQVGDLVDGYSELHLVMDELAQIRNLILIKGNHDEWFKEWMMHGIHPVGWNQGGVGSFKSYLKLIDKDDLWQQKGNGYITALNPEDVPPLHQKMLRSQVKYYIDDKNNLFIHGGFNRHFLLKDQQEYIFYWDRDLWLAAMSYESMSKGHDKLHGKDNNKFKMKESFNNIFIGHTATTNWSDNEIVSESGILINKGSKPITTPMKAANIYNLDTGGGFEGKVTIMNIDNPEEYYQSDLATELYPDEKGRRY